MGYSHFQGTGPHNYSIVDNFILLSIPTQRWILYPKVYVKVFVEDPNPLLGVSYKLPVQNWNLDVTYSYGFERTNTKLQTSLGTSENNLENPLSQMYEYSDAELLLPLNLTIRKKYFSHRLGLSLFMDYRRFVTLKITFRRDFTFARWVSNAVFSVIITKYFGLNLFFEYSERSVGTIRYWLMEPTFVFQI